MSEQASAFDWEFTTRTSNPDNYILDEAQYRPAPITGYLFSSWDYPALHTTLFQGRFAGEDQELLLPWTTKQEQYEGDVKSRIKQCTHYLHINEMEISATGAGFLAVDKPIFGFTRPVLPEDYTQFVFNTRDQTAVYDESDEKLFADLTDRIPNLTLALGKIVVQKGRISKIY